MTGPSYSLAGRPLRWRRIAISILAAAFGTTACVGHVATPSATSLATSPPSISAATASPTSAADLPSTESPAPVPGGLLAYGRFSPDGPHVFTSNTDGTDEQALLPSIAEGPRFSPDGRRLVVVVESPQGLIFSGFVNPDGSNFVRLDSPDPTLNLGCGSWSPDGSRLGCEAWDDTDLTRQGVYTVRASDGGDLTRVTTSPAGTHDGYCGGHSPDGRQLLFLRADLPDEKQATMMVVNVDGSDARPVIAQKVGLWCDWSPDGKTILTERSGSLLLVPVDGSQPSAITIDADAPVTATRASWSPDGTWIVFSRVTSTGEDIYIVRKDGTNLHQVTNTPGQDEEFGEWGIPAL
jgi:Tol biopolymer transport system component